ncbi:MAG: hypothetical protein AAF544_01365 [Bacteroidota bacterium]
MLDQLLSGLQSQFTSSLTDQTELNAEQATGLFPVAKDAITSGITGAVAGGNVGGVLDMLKGAVGMGQSSSGGGLADLAQNMVYKSIAGNFINKATSSLGLSEGLASQVSGLALPMILNKLGGAAQSHGDTDDIDEGSVMGALGLDAGGLLNKAKDLLGGSGLGNLFG